MDKIKRFIKKHWFLITIISIYIIYFSIYTISRNNAFYSGQFDLGNVRQTLWNTLHGHFFVETDPTGKVQAISRLSDHADLLMLIALPIYYLIPRLDTLLIFQSVIVALGAIPVYLYARDITKSKKIANLFALIFLLLPSVENPNVFEFHAVTLATTFMLFAFYLLYKKKFAWSIPFIFLSILGKEEVGFTIAFMMLYFFVYTNFPRKKIQDIKKNIIGTAKELFSNILKHKNENIFYIIVAIYSVLYSYIMISQVIPYFRDGPSLYLQNYRGASNGILGVVVFMISHPIQIILEQSWNGIKYIGALLGPTALFSFFSPLILLIALPEFLIDVLSRDPAMQSIFYQYPAVINPFIILASISGFMKLMEIIKRKDYLSNPKEILILPVICTLFFAYQMGPLIFSKNYQSFDQLSQNDNNEIKYLVHTIPKKDVITASNNVAVHFSNRLHIYVYPTGIEDSDYIITLDVNEPAIPNNFTQVYQGDRVDVYQKDNDDLISSNF